MPIYEYVDPRHWRRAVEIGQAKHDLELIARAKLVLDEVERGKTVITGEVGETIYFTCKEQKADPFVGDESGRLLVGIRNTLA